MENLDISEADEHYVDVNFKLCTIHKEPVKLICVRRGCNNRLLCPECITSHDRLHVKSIRKIDEVFQDNFISKLEAEFRSVKKPNTMPQHNSINFLLDQLEKAFYSFNIRVVEQLTNLKDYIKEFIESGRLELPQEIDWYDTKDSFQDKVIKYYKRGDNTTLDEFCSFIRNLEEKIQNQKSHRTNDVEKCIENLEHMVKNFEVHCQNEKKNWVPKQQFSDFKKEIAMSFKTFDTMQKTSNEVPTRCPECKQELYKVKGSDTLICQNHIQDSFFCLKHNEWCDYQKKQFCSKESCPSCYFFDYQKLVRFEECGHFGAYCQKCKDSYCLLCKQNRDVSLRSSNSIDMK